MISSKPRNQGGMRLCDGLSCKATSRLVLRVQHEQLGPILVDHLFVALAHFFEPLLVFALHLFDPLPVFFSHALRVERLIAERV